VGQYKPAKVQNEKIVMGSDRRGRVPVVVVVMLLVMIVFMFFGVEGVVAVTAVCFIGNLFVWRLKEANGKRKRKDRM
jgi:hypothetical protein